MVHISPCIQQKISLVIRKGTLSIFSYLALMLNLTEKACTWSFTEAYNSIANQFTVCIINLAR